MNGRTQVVGFRTRQKQNKLAEKKPKKRKDNSSSSLKCLNPHLRLAILPHGDARVGGTEIDADDVTVGGVHVQLLEVLGGILRALVRLQAEYVFSSYQSRLVIWPFIHTPRLVICPYQSRSVFMFGRLYVVQVHDLYCVPGTL